jgi:hypothetical protein
LFDHAGNVVVVADGFGHVGEMVAIE